MARTTERRVVRSDADKGSCPAAAGKVLPGGTLCFATAGGFATDVIAAGANKFLGVLYRTTDNSGGANGDASAEYERIGQFEFPVAGGVTQADVGAKVYAVDNDTLSKTATNQTYVGTIGEVVDSENVMVDLDPQAV